MGLLTKSWFWLIVITIILILAFLFVPVNQCQSIAVGADGIPINEGVTTYVSYFNYLRNGCA